MIEPPKIFLAQVDELIEAHLNNPKLLWMLTKQLHLSSSQAITEIAFRAGFQNLPYFSRCFLAEFGMSPSRFRSA